MVALTLTLTLTLTPYPNPNPNPNPNPTPKQARDEQTEEAKLGWHELNDPTLIKAP